MKQPKDINLPRFNFDKNKLDAKILADYPFVIASAYKDFLDSDGKDPMERFGFLTQGLFQTILRCLALIGVSEYCLLPQSCYKVNESLLKLSRPQYGHWVELLRNLKNHFSANPPKLFSEFMHYDTARIHKGLSISMVIDRFTSAKNILSHGGGPRDWAERFDSFCDQWTEHLCAWLDELRWLSNFDLYHRNPNGDLLKLRGLTPESIIVQERLHESDGSELFFSNGSDAVLNAFPLFFWLDRNVIPDEKKGVYLFNGATKKLIIYLSHAFSYEERDDDLHQRLTSLLKKKQISLRLTEGDLTIEGLISTANKQTRSKLDKAVSHNLYDAELYVSRGLVEFSLQYWLDHGKQGLIVCGEAGSGKTMTLCAFAERLLWRKEIVLLYRAREFNDTDSSYLETLIRNVHGLRRYEDLGRILAELHESGRRLIILIDSIEESRNPIELYYSIVRLLENYENQPLYIAFTIRDIFFNNMKRQIASNLEENRDRFTHYLRCDEDSGQSMPFYTIERLSDNEFNDFFSSYCKRYRIRTSLEEINLASRKLLFHPFILKIACECYSKPKILPAHLSPHQLFTRYLEIKLDEAYRRDCRDFLNRFVKIALDHMRAEIELDDLEVDDIIKNAMRDPDPSSPYHKLLNENIMVEILGDGWESASTLRINYDKLFEVLIAFRYMKDDIQILLSLVMSNQNFASLQGALEIRLLFDGGKKNAGPFSEVVPFLAEYCVRNPVLNALQDLSYTDQEFVAEVLGHWADSLDPEAIRAARELIVYIDKSGRWNYSYNLCKDILKLPAASSKDNSEDFAMIELYQAGMAIRLRDYQEAMQIFDKHKNSNAKNINIRCTALAQRAFLFDRMEDMQRFYKASAECVSVATDMQNPWLLAFGLWSLGTYYEYECEYQKALLKYDEVLKMEKVLNANKGDRTLCSVYPTIGAIYRWYARALSNIPERIAEAETYYLKSLEMNEKEFDLYQISIDWNNLSDYYQQRGMLDKALFYCDKEMVQEQLYPDDVEWGFSYFMRGCLMLMLDRLDDAQQALNRSLYYSESPGGSRLYRVAGYFAQVCLWLTANQLEQALKFAEKVEKDRHFQEKPDTEFELYRSGVQLALKVFQGFCTREELTKFVDDSKKEGLSVSACRILGMIVLPYIRQGKTFQVQAFALQILKSLSESIHNDFWIALAEEHLQFIVNKDDGHHVFK